MELDQDLNAYKQDREKNINIFVDIFPIISSLWPQLYLLYKFKAILRDTLTNLHMHLFPRWFTQWYINNNTLVSNSELRRVPFL